jgi:hypothetical protein
MGDNDRFFLRWRSLDSVRHWIDAHELIVILSLFFGGCLLTLLLAGSVFGAVVWVRQEDLDTRVERLEAILMRDASRPHRQEGVAWE